MDRSTTTSAPAASSILTASCISSQIPQPPPSPVCGRILEVSLISAQDLSPVTKSMHTFAVTWVDSKRKRTTGVDREDHHVNPTWNEKFLFRLSENAAASGTLTVEIYTAKWFRNLLVGSVQVPLDNLITPLVQNYDPKKTRFVALQVRGPSGSPQGIVNIGISLLSKNGMLNDKCSIPTDHEEKPDQVHLWRSRSVGSDMNGPGSIPYDESSIIDNGSDCCSDIGPSASIVAAEMAMNMKPSISQPIKGGSIMEELTIEKVKAKGYRINSKKDGSPKWPTDDECNGSQVRMLRNSRPKSVEVRRISCFGNAYGVECTISCGGGGLRKRKAAAAAKTTSSVVV